MGLRFSYETSLTAVTKSPRFGRSGVQANMTETAEENIANASQEAAKRAQSYGSAASEIDTPTFTISSCTAHAHRLLFKPRASTT